MSFQILFYNSDFKSKKINCRKDTSKHLYLIDWFAYHYNLHTSHQFFGSITKGVWKFCLKRYSCVRVCVHLHHRVIVVYNLIYKVHYTELLLIYYNTSISCIILLTTYSIYHRSYLTDYTSLKDSLVWKCKEIQWKSK